MKKYFYLLSALLMLISCKKQVDEKPDFYHTTQANKEARTRRELCESDPERPHHIWDNRSETCNDKDQALIDACNVVKSTIWDPDARACEKDPEKVLKLRTEQCAEVGGVMQKGVCVANKK